MKIPLSSFSVGQLQLGMAPTLSVVNIPREDPLEKMDLSLTRGCHLDKRVSITHCLRVDVMSTSPLVLGSYLAWTCACPACVCCYSLGSHEHQSYYQKLLPWNCPSLLALPMFPPPLDGRVRHWYMGTAERSHFTAVFLSRTTIISFPLSLWLGYPSNVRHGSHLMQWALNPIMSGWLRPQCLYHYPSMSYRQSPVARSVAGLMIDWLPSFSGSMQSTHQYHEHWSVGWMLLARAGLLHIDDIYRCCLQQQGLKMTVENDQ